MSSFSSRFVSWCPFWLEVRFIWHEYDSALFLWLSSGWTITFQAFTLSLCLSLELRWLSWGKHVAECCFLIHLVTSWLWIGEFDQFTFRVTIDKYLGLPFYLLFSGCSISPLLLFPCVSVYYFSWRVSMMFFSVSSFSISCLCSRFTFCDYYEVWKNVS